MNAAAPYDPQVIICRERTAIRTTPNRRFIDSSVAALDALAFRVAAVILTHQAVAVR